MLTTGINKQTVGQHNITVEASWLGNSHVFCFWQYEFVEVWQTNFNRDCWLSLCKVYMGSCVSKLWLIACEVKLSRTNQIMFCMSLTMAVTWWFVVPMCIYLLSVACKKEVDYFTVLSPDLGTFNSLLSWNLAALVCPRQVYFSLTNILKYCS